MVHLTADAVHVCYCVSHPLRLREVQAPIHTTLLHGPPIGSPTFSRVLFVIEGVGSDPGLVRVGSQISCYQGNRVSRKAGGGSHIPHALLHGLPIAFR
jgi:hypothetical protein